MYKHKNLLDSGIHLNCSSSTKFEAQMIWLLQKKNSIANYFWPLKMLLKIRISRKTDLSIFIEMIFSHIDQLLLN